MQYWIGFAHMLHQPRFLFTQMVCSRLHSSIYMVDQLFEHECEQMWRTHLTSWLTKCLQVNRQHALAYCLVCEDGLYSEQQSHPSATIYVCAFQLSEVPCCRPSSGEPQSSLGCNKHIYVNCLLYICLVCADHLGIMWQHNTVWPRIFGVPMFRTILQYGLCPQIRRNTNCGSQGCGVRIVFCKSDWSHRSSAPTWTSNNIERKIWSD